MVQEKKKAKKVKRVVRKRSDSIGNAADTVSRGAAALAAAPSQTPDAQVAGEPEPAASHRATALSEDDTQQAAEQPAGNADDVLATEPMTGANDAHTALLGAASSIAHADVAMVSAEDQTAERTMAAPRLVHQVAQAAGASQPGSAESDAWGDDADWGGHDDTSGDVAPSGSRIDSYDGMRSSQHAAGDLEAEAHGASVCKRSDTAAHSSPERDRPEDQAAAPADVAVTVPVESQDVHNEAHPKSASRDGDFGNGPRVSSNGGQQGADNEAWRQSDRDVAVRAQTPAHESAAYLSIAVAGLSAPMQLRISAGAHGHAPGNNAQHLQPSSAAVPLVNSQAGPAIEPMAHVQTSDHEQSSAHRAADDAHEAAASLLSSMLDKVDAAISQAESSGHTAAVRVSEQPSASADGFAEHIDRPALNPERVDRSDNAESSCSHDCSAGEERHSVDRLTDQQFWQETAAADDRAHTSSAGASPQSNGIAQDHTERKSHSSNGQAEARQSASGHGVAEQSDIWHDGKSQNTHVAEEQFSVRHNGSANGHAAALNVAQPGSAEAQLREALAAREQQLAAQAAQLADLENAVAALNVRTFNISKQTSQKSSASPQRMPAAAAI